MKVRTFVFGFVALLMLCTSAGPSSARSGVSPNLVEANHALLTFTIAPGGTHVFAFPVRQLPVRIDVSETALNKGTQNPTELLSVVVNQDPSSTQMTWLGMNSDGTPTAGNSGVGSSIAQITCGSGCTIATLSVNNLTPGRLEITQSSVTTTVALHYIVSIWY